MSTAVEVLGPARVRLVAAAPWQALAPVLREACAVRPPGPASLAGFGAGRLPFHPIDQQAGGTVLPRAVEAALLDLIGGVAREHGYEPLGRVDVDIVGCGERKALRFTAVIDVRPDITVPDPSSIVVPVGPASEQRLRLARDETLRQLTDAAAVPAPEGLLDDEVKHRRQWMLAELQHLGISLDDHLVTVGTTADRIDAELLAATGQRIRSQLLLDAVADADQVSVTHEEVRDAIAHRAVRAGIPVQHYEQELALAGADRNVQADVRRAKALASVMRQVTFTDRGGNPLAMDELGTG